MKLPVNRFDLPLPAPFPVPTLVVEPLNCGSLFNASEIFDGVSCNCSGDAMVKGVGDCSTLLMVRDPVTTTVCDDGFSTALGVTGACPPETCADTVDAKANMPAPILTFLTRILSPRLLDSEPGFQAPT